MILDRQLAVREAGPADRSAIATLARFEERVHAHLDWLPVEDWLGQQPFLVAERGQRVVGALACPPDPPHTAWLRLFTAVEDASFDGIWDLLWQRARRMLTERGVRYVAALSMDPWMEALCRRAGLRQTQTVVVLARPREAPPPEAQPVPGLRIREAALDEHPTITALDTAAFQPPWQMSPALMRAAIGKADLLTIAELDGQPVGFQLTTPSYQGAHLARLGVLPGWQGRGLGAALVQHLINHYVQRGAATITVNTQDTNLASLRLYQRFGFAFTDERFPMYQCELG